MTPKEWFLAKKGPKEGERVVRGHFHERVGDTSVLKMSLGVGPTPNLFPFPRTGHMKFAGGPTQIYCKFYVLANLICHTQNYNGA